ncbi:MAG: beta-N-acetylhexosaminidase [Firmicutes bacterium]|nr:beta-N-acetylhexosaminidase [Bacillota bacterium]
MKGLVTINIIPEPAEATKKDGKFAVDKRKSIFCHADLAEAVKFFNRYIHDLKGYTLPEGAENAAEIRFLQNSRLADEEYELEITTENMTVEASTAAGCLYAVQTIRQLAGFDLLKKDEDILLRACIIKDRPRFKWRGLMLDESRHFFGKNEVKRILDWMLMNKLNVFHWHLTDDQGWRIEIKKYPLLTEIGSVRKGTHIHGWQRANLKKDVIWEEYGGFYTQEDIKEIVQYAAERNISVYPEIDMPAHFAAAMAAYKYLGCRELEREVPFYFGGKIPLLKLGLRDWNRSACAGKESTYRFIFDVIDELVTLFPFPYFHIGGDEAPKSEWKKCPHCQKVIREKGLKNEEELQSHFNNRIAAYLREKGRRLIGWNEILNTPLLDRSVIGQYWTLRRDKHAENYVNEGGNLIMSRHHAFYFDMPYAQNPLPTTYNFEPVHQGIKPESEKRILGMEAPLWTEWIDGREKLDLNLFPRMQALAEVCWTPKEKKNFADFLQRLKNHKLIMEKRDVNYARDHISMPRNKIRKARDIRLWYRKDQHFEVRRNRACR